MNRLAQEKRIPPKPKPGGYRAALKVKPTALSWEPCKRIFGRFQSSCQELMRTSRCTFCCVAATPLSARYAPSITRKTIVILKMILRAAVDWDYLDRGPTEGARLSLPKTKRRVFEPLTRDQVESLISHAPEYWQPFYRFLLTSGVRRAEAWGITVGDLDLDKGIVHIRRQLVRKGFVDLKTDAAYRKVPLPTSTFDALRLHLETRRENDLDLLFPTPESRPVDPPNFYARVWIPTREKAGLPESRMHDCRHHVASVYLSQGRSITYVQRLLGHANPSMLLSIYSWVTKGEEDVATSDFERWMSEEEKIRYGLRRSAA